MDYFKFWPQILLYFNMNLYPYLIIINHKSQNIFTIPMIFMSEIKYPNCRSSSLLPDLYVRNKYLMSILVLINRRTTQMLKPQYASEVEIDCLLLL